MAAGRPVGRVVSAVLVGLAVAGCTFPGESTEESEVVLGVSVGEPERAEDRVRHTFDLHVTPADADALGLPGTVVPDRYGHFRLPTTHTRRGSKSWRHCVEGDWPIVEVATGEEVGAVAEGTCLEAGRTLAVAVPGRR